MPPAGKRGGQSAHRPQVPSISFFDILPVACTAPARSRRSMRSTSVGATPKCAMNLRWKVRRDMPQASAMSSIDQRADSRASIFCTSSRNGAPARSCSRRVWLYWRWSPPRHEDHQPARHLLRQFGTVVALDQARARSMPAETPAEVQYLPLST